MTSVFDVFDECARAITDRVLIHRASDQDKEFHFQNWVRQRLEALDLSPHQTGRNSFPDFVLPNAEGYEVKGLAHPGRYLNYDSNSQPPTGAHDGWSPIFYVFGRYPKGSGETFPVLDLVICHGDFLNADHEYVHRNRHVKGFGSYGDIMIRDRKMYVVPTPYALAGGIDGEVTLIVPAEESPPAHLQMVGELERREAQQILLGYDFDLKTSEIEPRFETNPNAGHQHPFRAYHPRSTMAAVTVAMRGVEAVAREAAVRAAELDATGNDDED